MFPNFKTVYKNSNGFVYLDTLIIKIVSYILYNSVEIIHKMNKNRIPISECVKFSFNPLDPSLNKVASPSGFDKLLLSQLRS